MAKYGLNKVNLIGNLGAAPEVSHTDQGVPYARLRLALTERVRTRDGNQQDRTEWVDVIIWRGQAEVAGQYLKKGSTVFIEGRLRNNSWQTPEGERRSRLEIEGTRLIMLDSPSSSQPPYEGGAPVQPQTASSTPSAVSPSVSTSEPQTHSSSAQSEDGDDLPF